MVKSWLKYRTILTQKRLLFDEIDEFNDKINAIPDTWRLSSR